VRHATSREPLVRPTGATCPVDVFHYRATAGASTAAQGRQRLQQLPSGEAPPHRPPPPPTAPPPTPGPSRRPRTQAGRFFFFTVAVHSGGRPRCWRGDPRTLRPSYLSWPQANRSPRTTPMTTKGRSVRRRRTILGTDERGGSTSTGRDGYGRQNTRLGVNGDVHGVASRPLRRRCAGATNARPTGSATGARERDARLAHSDK